MIKVSVMYPNSPGDRFDHDYRNKHMPLIKHRMGQALKYYAVKKGLSGGTPDAPPTYVGVCNLLCDSVEAYHNAFDPHARELFGDIRNFTPFGRIRISLERTDDQLVLSVEDNGVGIVSERLPQVFDLFSRLGAAPEGSERGLPIGLALVRTIAELHGGTVEARSVGTGHGSNFIVRLPICDEVRSRCS